MKRLLTIALLASACSGDPPPVETCSDMAVAVCAAAAECGEVKDGCESIVEYYCLAWDGPCVDEEYSCEVIEGNTWWDCLR